MYSIFGWEITKYTVIYGVSIRFWPTLQVSQGEVAKLQASLIAHRIFSGGSKLTFSMVVVNYGPLQKFSLVLVVQIRPHANCLEALTEVPRLAPTKACNSEGTKAVCSTTTFAFLNPICKTFIWGIYWEAKVLLLPPSWKAKPEIIIITNN